MSESTEVSAIQTHEEFDSSHTIIRRQRMSVEKRYRIIKALDQGMTRSQVMRQFNLKHSSNITTILKSRDLITSEMQKGTRLSAKAIRSHKFPVIDETLIHMIHQSTAAGQPVSRQDLAQNARLVALRCGIYYRFMLTPGYLDNFLSRNPWIKLTEAECYVGK